MEDSKSFASLTPSLLARKGGARPAMRPQLLPLSQLHENVAHQINLDEDDLGWNDHGEDHGPLPATDQISPASESVRREARIVPIKGLVEERPLVKEEKRFEIFDLGHNFTQLVIHYGFKDEIDIPEELEKTRYHGLVINPDDTTYFVGKETIIPTTLPGMAIWREFIFAWISRNASSVIDYYNLPSKRVMEVGTRIDI